MEPIIENLNLKKEKRMILREKEFYKNYSMNDIVKAIKDLKVRKQIFNKIK